MNGRKITLHDAARDGHPRTVVRLLRQGAGLDEPDAQGWTALMIASVQGKVAMVEHLLRLGASPNARTPDGKTALYFAAWSGEVSVLEALQAGGAETAFDAEDALRAAVRKDRLDALRWLLARGCAVDATDADGETPLSVAVCRDRWSIAEALIDAGARGDRGARDAAIQTLLQKGRNDLVARLIARGGVSIGPSAIAWVDTAALCGNLVGVEALVAAGAPFEHERPDETASPLLSAASNGHLDMVRWLHERGARLDRRDERGMNAHTRARMGAHDELAAWLEARGVARQAEFDEEVDREVALVLARRKDEAEALRALEAFDGVSGRVTGGAFANFVGRARPRDDGALDVMVAIFGRTVVIKLDPRDWEAERERAQ